MRIIILTIAFLSITAAAQSKHLHHERWYQEKYCSGKTEVIMPDKTRCDCLTETHAIEFDFAPKFYEAIGQSLYYGLQTGKKPGIYLIIESGKDYKYWIRLNSVIEHYKLPIDTWRVDK